MKLDLTMEARDHAKNLRPVKTFLAKVCGRKIYIGHEQREGFEELTPFYLFWCRRCEHWAKDHSHGNIDERYLICCFCEVTHDFIPWWLPLAECWQTRKILWQYFWGCFKDELVKRFRRLGELFLVVAAFLLYFSLAIGLSIHGKITGIEHVLD